MEATLTEAAQHTVRTTHATNGQLTNETVDQIKELAGCAPDCVVVIGWCEGVLPGGDAFIDFTMTHNMAHNGVVKRFRMDRFSEVRGGTQGFLIQKLHDFAAHNKPAATPDAPAKLPDEFEPGGKYEGLW